MTDETDRRRDPWLDRAYGATTRDHNVLPAGRHSRLTKMLLLGCHCLASAAFSTVLQSAGICASVIGGRGFGGFGGGFGCSTESLNQKARSDRSEEHTS